ncbi:hypothetical protein ACI2OX_11655 [Bacillus sp. N9]
MAYDEHLALEAGHDKEEGLRMVLKLFTVYADLKLIVSFCPYWYYNENIGLLKR